jgi:hypothetical protein
MAGEGGRVRAGAEEGGGAGMKGEGEGGGRRRGRDGGRMLSKRIFYLEPNCPSPELS